MKSAEFASEKRNNAAQMRIRQISSCINENKIIQVFDIASLERAKIFQVESVKENKIDERYYCLSARKNGVL